MSLARSFSSFPCPVRRCPLGQGHLLESDGDTLGELTRDGCCSFNPYFS